MTHGPYDPQGQHHQINDGLYDLQGRYDPRAPL